MNKGISCCLHHSRAIRIAGAADRQAAGHGDRTKFRQAETRAAGDEWLELMSAGVSIRFFKLFRRPVSTSGGMDVTRAHMSVQPFDDDAYRDLRIIAVEKVEIDMIRSQVVERLFGGFGDILLGISRASGSRMPAFRDENNLVAIAGRLYPFFQ